MANVQLEHAKHIGLTHALDGTDLVLTSPTEAVAGGAGFPDTSGAVTMNLASARAFHHKMIGAITSLAFSNIPTTTAYSSVWTWVLWIDATGGYAFPTGADLPTVTWRDGAAWTDLVLTANATNIVQFYQVGTVTYAILVRAGADTPLEPYKVCFLENGTILILTEDEDIDVANATKHGTGTVTYARNGTAITARTAFDAGDRLSVICASATDTTTARIPRYIT